LVVFETCVIEPGALQDLVAALRARGYRVVGPTVRDGAIVYEDIESADGLPVGWTDSQDGGTYRLQRRDDEARFGYAVGPHSWKRFLFPSRVRLWQARREDGGFVVEEEPGPDAPFALFGVRSCDLHAIEIQDRVFMGGSYVPQHRRPQRRARVRLRRGAADRGRVRGARAAVRARRARRRDPVRRQRGPARAALHRYRLDADGSILDAKIVPPTSQNQRAIEDDLRGVVGRYADLDDEALRNLCEQAIRNYDPCISCATHFLTLDIERR
jgi:hypothetical protein